MDQVVIEATAEWMALKHNSQFQLFLLWLRQTVEEHQRLWAKRQYESDEIHVWTQLNAAALGRVDLCQDILDLFDNLGQQEKQNEE